MPEPPKKLFPLVITAIVLLFLAFLVLSIGCLYTIGPKGWAIFVPAGIFFALLLWQLRRKEKKAVQRFETFAPTPDAEFLEALQLSPSAPEAEIALAARRAFAKLGSVPPESLKPSHRFYPDLQKLPFYDSIDFLGIIFELEEQTHMKISKDDGEHILKNFGHPESATIGETVLNVVGLWRRQQAEGASTITSLE
jgi:hypothetical protein